MSATVAMRVYSEVAREAAWQWGMFTSAQARTLGASAQQMSTWCRRGLVDREAHGVYRVVGAPTDLGLDGVRIAWLAITPQLWAHERMTPVAVVSHLSAAHTVYRLGTSSPGKDHLSVIEPCRTRAGHVQLHFAPGLSAADWHWVDGLPVTTVARTLADLYTDSALDGGHLGDVIRDALQHGHAAHTLAATLDPVTGGRGRVVLEQSLATCGAPAGSAAASDLLNPS